MSSTRLRGRGSYQFIDLQETNRKASRGLDCNSWEGLPADHARAMFCVAYDTMASSRELVPCNVEDLEWMHDGSGTVLIRRSKIDQEGQGSLRCLSRETVKWRKVWIQAMEAGARQRCVQPGSL
jgi:hypothetical protein